LLTELHQKQNATASFLAVRDRSKNSNNAEVVWQSGFEFIAERDFGRCECASRHTVSAPAVAVVFAP
jgi:hypothetical protein